MEAGRPAGRWEPSGLGLGGVAVFKIYCDGTAGKTADKVKGEGRSRVKDDTHVCGLSNQVNGGAT